MATPRVIKQISRSAGVRWIFCWIGALYIRLVWLTGRWRVEGADTVRKLWAEGRPFIVVFWHGRLLMMPYAWRSDKPFHMLISDHPDGRLISGIVRYFGISTASGSTTRGGSAAFRAMVKMLKDGETVGITPDGPAGPRMRASGGAVALARLSGAPIVPLSFGASRRRTLKSWDKFVVPLPFGAGTLIWGEPIEVAADADEAALEAARAHLEDVLNRMTGEADRRHGQEPIQPAPAEPPSAAEAAEARP